MKTKKAIITLVLAMTVAVVVTTTTVISVQPAFAPGGACSTCAKSFAPGQLAINSEGQFSARSVAPGQDFGGGHCNNCNGASQFAPGRETTVTNNIALKHKKVFLFLGEFIQK